MEKNSRQRPNRGRQTSARKKNSSNFVLQGGILAAAGLIVRLIGMVYRIPLINIIGDEGNGYYTAAFNIYSILLIVSSYSLPTAVSKMISTCQVKGEYKNSMRILKAALVYGTIVGALGAGALWFGADFFASMLEMPYASYALKTLAPTILIIAYLGVLRGYFQGLGTMVPTAVSQILEQIVNAVISIVAAYKLYEYGLKVNLVHDGTEYAYAYGASGGTIGTGAGAVAALLFFLVLAWGYRPVMRRQARRDKSRQVKSYTELSWMLFMTVFPIVLSSTIYNISSVVDNVLFGQGMEKLGMADQIASVWGVFGKYHLLFMIPVAISNALSSSLIPSIARAVAAKDSAQVVNKVAVVIRCSMIIAIPASVGLTVLAGPVNKLLFGAEMDSLLVKLTAAGAFAVLFFSLSTVTNAVLQGINRLKLPVVHSAVALVIHVAVLWVMLTGLQWGIYSVVFSNMIFALIVCVLNNLAIGRALNYRQEMKKTFVIPLIASAVMGAAAFGVYKGVYLVVKSNLLGTLVSILAAVLVYGVLLIKLGCIDEAELYEMPAGRKLVRLARKLRLF